VTKIAAKLAEPSQLLLTHDCPETFSIQALSHFVANYTSTPFLQIEFL
jgi:hypothetical protein